MSDISVKIIQDLNDLKELLEQQADLKLDVFPFINPTLLKIEQLASKSDEFELDYELIQIASNYLPRTFSSYCSLPIDYRNTKPIKNNKTARELLIEDLKNIRKQVETIEEMAFSKITRDIKINNSFITEKFSSGMQLASQQAGENGFVNVFDIESFKQTNEYGHTFKKTARPSFEKSAKNSLAKTVPVVKNTAIAVFDHSVSFGQASVRFFNKNSQVFASLLILSFVIAFIYGLGYLLHVGIRYAELKGDFSRSISSIYQVMESNKIDQATLSNLVKTQHKELIDESEYRAKHSIIKMQGQNIVANLNGLDDTSCINMVNESNITRPSSSLIVNNIVYKINPNDTLGQELSEAQRVCHLSEENSFTIVFNPDKIHHAFIENIGGNRQEKLNILKNKLKIVQEKISNSKSASEVSIYLNVKNNYELEITRLRSLLDITE